VDVTLKGNWSYPTEIRFGAGRVKDVTEACLSSGIKKPLMVTDKGLADLPMTASVFDDLESSGLQPNLFSGVDPNPSDLNLEAGLNAFRAGGHDGVVAFGGGSGLDLGKLIAFQAGQSRPVWDFEDIGDNWTRADRNAIAPNIAVPTTAGTGSEVGRAGVLTHSQTHIKKVIFHPGMLPSIAICDPELTVSMPQVITVGTGLDAFIHCLEAYCSPSYHPLSQGIALEGMRLVKENLPLVFNDPKDIVARGHMMVAATMGATAFQKGLGGMHALSHPVSALYGTHHGMTNAVVMAEVLKFNRPAIEESLALAAAYLEIAGGFDGFFEFILKTRSDFGVPSSLRALGAGDDRVEEMAAMAIDDPCAGGNPLPLTQEAAVQLYKRCL
jgi:alcohol dehydrogenase class IV